MIVRILHDKQYQIPESLASKLDSLDYDLSLAVEESNRELFDRKLAEIIDSIRQEGEELPPDKLLPSDITVPAPGCTLEEIKELLAENEQPQ